MEAPVTVAVLSGGVGAARLLRGVQQVVAPEAIAAIVNTGDDVILHGLHISPDIDTIIYTLADAVNPETGWGLAGETWQAMSMVERYGGVSWFNLGDRDLGTHLYRTHRLGEGATLTEVTGEIARAWGLGVNIVPMSDDRVQTRVTVPDDGEIGFQEYFVERRHGVPVSAVRFAGAEAAALSPAAASSLATADVVIVAPSNPLVSIAPLLAVPGLRDAVVARRATTVAVSPIVGGKAIKGPAEELLRGLGHEASAVGVATMYRDIASVLVIDQVDAEYAADIEAIGMRCIVTDTIMSSPGVSASLARHCLDAVSA